jgi:hypothetical protein
MGIVKLLRLGFACWALMAALVATSARAVVVPADGSALLPGTSLAADASLAGTVIAELVVPFSFTVVAGGFPDGPQPVGTVSGSFESLVVREDGSGTLDFYWRVSNDADSYTTISTLELRNFAPAPYDADWRTDLAGDRGFSSATAYTLDVPAVFFNIQIDTSLFAYLQPGESSDYAFLRTDATQFAQTAWMNIAAADAQSDTGGLSGRIYTFAPAVPEPASVALMLLGLAWVAARAVRQGRAPERRLRYNAFVASES